MKKITCLIVVILATFTITGCGSGKPYQAVIEGPELSLSEAEQLLINHFYVKSWDGVGKSVFFNVYIQDATFGNYLVCAGQAEGLNVTSQTGVYYGKLQVEMTKVDDAVDNEPYRFNIIIVADQEEACPALPDESKIVSTKTVDFNDLLDSPIEFGAGDAYITFIGRGHDDVAIKEMPSLEDDSLSIGELYFKDDDADDDKIPDYYLVLFFTDGSGFRQVDYADMPEMRSPEIIYSWLDLPFEDISESDLGKNVWIVLNRLGTTGPEKIGETESIPLEDLYGHKFDFINDNGYIKFRETE